MKKLISILLLLLSSIVYAQQTSFINASTYSSITWLEFDKSDNAYMCGSVRGRVNINGADKDYTDKHAWIIGKLTSENNFAWVIELPSLPRDFAMIDDKFYALMQERVDDGKTDTYSMVLYSYDINGVFLNKKNITTITGTKYDVFVDGRFLGNQIVTWATMEDEDTYGVVDNVKLSKKMYSLYQFKAFDVSGNFLWQYKMEGGIDGFTELRMQAIDSDKKGNIYITCYFGVQSDLGIATYNTDIMYKAKLSLYYDKIFLLKLNSHGVPVKSAILAENDLTVEDVLVDNKGDIYFSGYHKGNDVFAKKQEDARPYIGAKFFGKAFEFTEEESIEAPGENGFIGKVDSSWNLLWVKNVKGSTGARVTEMATYDGKIALTGLYSSNLNINGNVYKDHTENKGYMEGFYSTISKNGDWGDVVTFTCPESNGIHVHQKGAESIILSGSTKEKYIMVNGIQQDCAYYCYWGGSFLYRPK